MDALSAFPRYAFSVLTVVLGVVLLATSDERRRRRQIAARGAESNICAFARAFDYRRLDPRLLRAVYEELGNSLSAGGKPFPVRATDRLFDRDGLDLDAEDVDDVLAQAAHRAGRSLHELEQNPWYDKVVTVADLVSFLAAQPQVTA